MAARQGGAQGECASHRATLFLLHLLTSEEPEAYPTENNNWTSNGNGTGCSGFVFLFYCKAAFTARILPAIKLLSGSLSSQNASQGKEPGETLSHFHTYGSSTHPCHPGSPAGHRTASSWGCSCAAAGTRTRTCCSVLGALGTWPSRWVLHTAASEETTHGTTRLPLPPGGPKPVPGSRLH